MLKWNVPHPIPMGVLSSIPNEEVPNSVSQLGVGVPPSSPGGTLGVPSIGKDGEYPNRKDGGTPYQVGWGYPPPTLGNGRQNENITFHHPWEAGGNYLIPNKMK